MKIVIFIKSILFVVLKFQRKKNYPLQFTLTQSSKHSIYYFIPSKTDHLFATYRVFQKYKYTWITRQDSVISGKWLNITVGDLEFDFEGNFLSQPSNDLEFDFEGHFQSQTSNDLEFDFEDHFKVLRRSAFFFL